MSKNKLPSRSNHANPLTGGSAISRLVFIFAQLPNLVKALPIFSRNVDIEHNDIAEAMIMTPELFYTNLFTSVFLVLAGGVFAGLTLGLMGQDEVYLKVIATSGEPQERSHARKVLKLIGRGKHWVLVTLLLSNVITNETLPIVLDRCLGGGWPAVITSTVSIVIFGGNYSTIHMCKIWITGGGHVFTICVDVDVRYVPSCISLCVTFGPYFR